MPFDIAAAAGSEAVNTAGSIIQAGMGLALEKHNDKRQLRQQGKLQQLQIQGSKDMMDYSQLKQLEMWEKTGYGAQMKQLKEAGLNPGLLYGMGGGGAQTVGSANGSVGGANAPSGGGEAMGMIGMGIQARLLEAQRENIEADTEQKRAVTAKTSGVDTENVKADTENKVLASVIAQYTGKEMKDQYERIKQPNRGIEEKTYQDELVARQGIAQTIGELWAEGKLKDKSVAEIESILLGNAKTREETRKIYKDMELLEQNIKGAKLENVIRDLETRLQTETGIDRNSPAWMKVLGRLFVQLMGK